MNLLEAQPDSSQARERQNHYSAGQVITWERSPGVHIQSLLTVFFVN